MSDCVRHNRRAEQSVFPLRECDDTARAGREITARQVAAVVQLGVSVQWALTLPVTGCGCLWARIGVMFWTDGPDSDSCARPRACA